MVKRERKNHLNSLRSNHQLCKRGVCAGGGNASHLQSTRARSSPATAHSAQNYSLPSLCRHQNVQQALVISNPHLLLLIPQLCMQLPLHHKFDRMQLYISSNHRCDKTPLAYCTLPAAVHFSAFHPTQFAAIESQWVIVSAPSSCELLQKVTGT